MSTSVHDRGTFRPRLAHRRNIRKAAPLSLALVLAMGCGDAPAAPKDNVPATITITGVQSSYTAGEKVTVSAKAVRKDLAPIAGLPITFAASTSGTADPATAITDANGVATTTWTVPVQAGFASLRASNGPTSRLVTTEVSAAAAAHLNKLVGDAQDGIAGELLTNVLRVSVTDAFGNAILGRAVAFVVTSGGGSVSVSNVNTAVDGSASTEWRVGAGTTSNTLEVRTLNLPTATFTATSRVPAGTFALTGSMATARYGHTATLLQDGRVLVAGGTSATDRGSTLATAELYDPATGRFTATANTMTLARADHSATLLADGRVLIAGGMVDGSGAPTTGADLFDPATNTFLRTGNLLEPQSSHEGTLLRSGEVLITGGPTFYIDDYGYVGTRAELYNPATGLFRYTGEYADSLPDYPYYGLARIPVIPARLLSNGMVLIASMPRAELYDPATGRFAATGSMLTPISSTYLAGRTATRLTNGNVLLTGGHQALAGGFSKAELYDPATGMFRYTASMPLPRDGHTATRLPSGEVLIAGGESLSRCSSTGCDMFSVAGAEVFDANGTAWTAVGPMKVRRQEQRATLLQDGRVLITGGLTFDAGFNAPFQYTVLKSAELYTKRP